VFLLSGLIPSLQSVNTFPLYANTLAHYLPSLVILFLFRSILDCSDKPAKSSIDSSKLDLCFDLNFYLYFCFYFYFYPNLIFNLLFNSSIFSNRHINTINNFILIKLYNNNYCKSKPKNNHNSPKLITYYQSININSIQIILKHQKNHTCSALSSSSSKPSSGSSLGSNYSAGYQCPINSQYLSIIPG